MNWTQKEQAKMFNQDLAKVKKMRIKDNSIRVNEKYVIIKRGRNRWRVGEASGDWLLSGNAETVVKRAYEMPVFPEMR